jgi:hypothetical protein
VTYAILHTSLTPTMMPDIDPEKQARDSRHALVNAKSEGSRRTQKIYNEAHDARADQHAGVWMDTNASSSSRTQLSTQPDVYQEADHHIEEAHPKTPGSMSHTHLRPFLNDLGYTFFRHAAPHTAALLITAAHSIHPLAPPTTFL